MGGTVSIGMAAPVALQSNRSSISWGIGGHGKSSQTRGNESGKGSEERKDSDNEDSDMEEEEAEAEQQDLNISFEYQCRQTVTPLLDISGASKMDSVAEFQTFTNDSPPLFGPQRSSSFSCFSGAAIGANVTLANTTLNKNTIGGIVLPGLDSPRAFRTLNGRGPFSRSNSSSGSSFAVLGGASLSRNSSGSSSASPLMLHMSPPGSVPGLHSPPTNGKLSTSAPEISGLQPFAVRTAGGPAGEDRVQAVCSEENGWLYCAVYDGFNGRDAADYLAAHLYECIMLHLRLLDWQATRGEQGWDDSRAEKAADSGCTLSEAEKETAAEAPISTEKQTFASAQEHGNHGGHAVAGEKGEELPTRRSGAAVPANETISAMSMAAEGLAEQGVWEGTSCRVATGVAGRDIGLDLSDESNGDDGEAFRQAVMVGLRRSVVQTETDFLDMVEQEMDERPDLAMVGSCVLAVLLHGQDLYTVNLGDSRAVLATEKPPGSEPLGAPAGSGLYAVQLTEDHTVSNEAEKRRVIQEHSEDPHAVVGLRVKGKLRVTRAMGAGYLKYTKFNNALMGILRVRDLESPPYVSAKPFVSSRRVRPEDRFVVVGSDGLFDFFSNAEVVAFVWRFVSQHPGGDPAKFMLEQMLQRAAQSAGLTVDELRSVPIGRRRKYHDDVTIVVITLGHTFRTTSASTLF